MAQPEDEFQADEFEGANRLEPQEWEIQASPADAAEQATPANPAEEPVEIHRGIEVDEWDALEQARVVDFDEDYR